MSITKVQNELIAINAISGTLIADNAVTSVHIAKNNIGTVQIAENSVTSVSIAQNNVTGVQIANNAVTSTQLADNAVTATKIPDGTQLALGATAFSSSVAISGAASAAISEGLLIDYSTNLARFLTYDSSTGSEIAFYTQPNGGSTTQALRIDSSQDSTFAGNVSLGGTDGDNAVLSLTANTGNWVFTNVQSNRNLEISDSDGTGTVLTITTSGNVGIGTTNPYSGTNVTSLTVSAASYPSVALQISGTTAGLLMANSAGLDVYATGNKVMNFITDDTTRMRIDGSGKVGIGTTSPNEPLTIRSSAENINCSLLEIGNDLHATNTKDAWIKFVCGAAQNDNSWAVGAYPGSFRFSYLGTRGTAVTTASAERMRITSSGDLLLGCTSSAQASDTGIKLREDDRLYMVNAHTSGEQISYYGNGGYKFYVAISGSIYSTNTSISGISDGRLKENVRDLDTGLEQVLALQPRRFDWKENEGTGQKDAIGFVAQEVEAVLPDVIDDFKHDVYDDAKSVKTTDIVPTLVKAIQEQQEQIETLKKEVAALKG